MVTRYDQIRQQLSFQYSILEYLTSGVVYKFQRELNNQSYYNECVKHLNVRICEHIDKSPLTKNKLSLRTAKLPIIYHFATIQHTMVSFIF